MTQLERLYMEVEMKRNILHRRMQVYRDFTHPKIMQISQEIDALLNRIEVMKLRQSNLEQRECK